MTEGGHVSRKSPMIEMVTEWYQTIEKEETHSCVTAACRWMSHTYTPSEPTETISSTVSSTMIGVTTSFGHSSHLQGRHIGDVREM